MSRGGSIDPFYRRLEDKEAQSRIERILANRPADLHDYQGCANDAASKLPTERTEEDGPEWECWRCGDLTDNPKHSFHRCHSCAEGSYQCKQSAALPAPTRAYELAMFLTRNGQQGNAPEMQREIEQFYADKGDRGE